MASLTDMADEGAESGGYGFDVGEVFYPKVERSLR